MKKTDEWDLRVNGATEDYAGKIWERGKKTEWFRLWRKLNRASSKQQFMQSHYALISFAESTWHVCDPHR